MPIINSVSTSQNYSHFIGRAFQLTEHNVVIEDVLAEGGFSVVFVARSSNGKRYALKRMCVNNSFDLEICKQEIDIIKSLSSVNKKILKYVDSFIYRQPNDIYEILLLTKYCKLGGLVQLMNDRLTNHGILNRLSESEIISIFCDICEAVADLHENGIIHRDLKIENILIDDRVSSNSLCSKRNDNCLPYTFLLCDFGSATRIFFDRRLNSSTQNIQLISDEIQKYTTIAYRSPEMVDLYSNKLITTKSDIWALGCLLYKLCYYQTPFGESLLAIQEGRFTIPDNKANFYSKELNSLINYMLETDPTKRPDIFQVSYLIFTLAEKACPIKNINSSEHPNFNQLAMPLTESEWRKNVMALNQLKKQGNLGSNEGISTTVNPRERPKANSNSVNSMISLIPGVNNKQNTNLKFKTNDQTTTLPIKPPPAPSSSHQQYQQQSGSSPFSNNQLNNNQKSSSNQLLGFEDDFSFFKPNIQQDQQACSIQNISKSPLDSISNMSSLNRSPLLLQPAPSEKKSSHRRSVSHSTITLQPNFQMKHSQTNISGGLASAKTNLSTSEFQSTHLTPNQCRSASPSSQKNNELIKTETNKSNMDLLNELAHDSFNSLVKNTPNSIETTTNIQQNKNNPFGDNFSGLNDNDLFGLEFDKIRSKNEDNFTSPIYPSQPQHQPQSQPQIQMYHQYPNQSPISSLIKPTSSSSSVFITKNNTNNIQFRPGNNFYQNVRTHVKSNSCSSIGLNQLLKLNSINNNNNNNNINSNSKNNNQENHQNQTFITHL